MAVRGAQPGNNNAEKGKRWRTAIDAALAKNGRDKAEALAEVAEKLIDKAKEGDMSAIKELGDRIDGKSVQPMDIKGELHSKVSYTVKGLGKR